MVVKYELVGNRRVEQIACGGVENPLGLPGAAGSIKYEQGVLGLHDLRLAAVGLVGNKVVPPEVPSLRHGDLARSASQNNAIADAFKAFNGLIGDCFQRNRLGTAETFIRGNHDAAR